MKHLIFVIAMVFSINSQASTMIEATAICSATLIESDKRVPIENRNDLNLAIGIFVRMSGLTAKEFAPHVVRKSVEIREMTSSELAVIIESCRNLINSHTS